MYLCVGVILWEKDIFFFKSGSKGQDIGNSILFYLDDFFYIGIVEKYSIDFIKIVKIYSPIEELYQVNLGKVNARKARRDKGCTTCKGQN